jgi:hypothetical protein
MNRFGFYSDSSSDFGYEEEDNEENEQNWSQGHAPSTYVCCLCNNE